MMTFDGYSLEIADSSVMSAAWPNIWRLGVVVFTRPEDSVCRDIITPSLHYLHELTGERVHFYFVGFCNNRGGGYQQSVSTEFLGTGSNWFFSPRDFVSVQARFEKLTSNRWQYSGGTDILVVPYRIRHGIFYIDASKALDIKLTKIAKNSNGYIPEEILQIIIRQLVLGKDIDGVSNSRIMDALTEGFKKSFLGLFANSITDGFNVLEPFAVKSLV